MVPTSGLFTAYLNDSSPNGQSPAVPNTTMPQNINCMTTSVTPHPISAPTPVYLCPLDGARSTAGNGLKHTYRYVSHLLEVERGSRSGLSLKCCGRKTRSSGCGGFTRLSLNRGTLHVACSCMQCLVGSD